MEKPWYIWTSILNDYMMLVGYFRWYLLCLGHWVVMCLFTLTTGPTGNGIIVV